VQKLEEDEIIPNSHLLLIAALKIMLQNEIKVKSNKSQAKILQKIEDENKERSGLSVSNTSKILPKANKAYKALNNL
jgi:hypothetical protein